MTLRNELVFVYGKTSIAVDPNYAKKQVGGTDLKRPDDKAGEESEEGIKEEPQDSDKFAMDENDEELNLIQPDKKGQVPLPDEEFKLNVYDVLKMRRVVECYQWVENKIWVEDEVQNQFENYGQDDYAPG